MTILTYSNQLIYLNISKLFPDKLLVLKYIFSDLSVS